ncbi:MAG TPA: ABC transporter permease subunit [Nautiliaceae bacterium]|nr:ABC transporter permease subunit [Nautiliaceae bacterium]
MWSKYKNFLGTLLFVLILLMIWQILALNPEISKKFSSPYEVISTLITELLKNNLLDHVFYSYINITIGFIIGNLIGALLGTLFWLNENLGKIVNPVLFLLSSIPVFAIAPMTILWWGAGDFAKIMIVFLHVFFVAIFYTYKSIGEIREELFSFFRNYVGMNNFQAFIHIILPSYIIWLPNMLKFTVSFAVLGEFVAEFIVSDKGIGHYIIKATGLYDVPKVLVGIIFLMLYPFLINSLLNIYKNYIKRKFSSSTENIL